MQSSHARKRVGTVGLVAVLLSLAMALTAQQPSEPLTPGQSPPTKPPSQTQPGEPDSGQGPPVQNVPQNPQYPGSPPPSGNSDAARPQTPSVVFESHGLEYEAITRNGITVMFAQLPSRLKEFNIVQVTVTNGSLVSWTVRPNDFTYVRQEGPPLYSVSADYVVAELLQHANRDDVIKLQLLYENSIYGLSNFRSTNGYEKRRESAMAQFVNRGFKAAAQASSIAFVPTKLKPGDSTDGAIFFANRTKEKALPLGRLVAHSCGETFIFEVYPEYRKRP